MIAAKMRMLTIHLESRSPIIFCLEDGTILNIVETQVIPELAVDTDGKAKRIGPSRLVFALRPVPQPEIPEPSTNGVQHPPPPPVPEKKAGMKTRGSGV